VVREAPKPLEVVVVIPARNEEANIAGVIAAIPPRVARAVVVVDNGSSDRTAQRAEDAGAIVVREAHEGYGAACLRGVSQLSTLPRPPDAVVFLPADGSADPAQIPALLAPLRENLFDLVIGSRALGDGRGATRIRARYFVATHLIRAIYGHRYTDLGPLRAVRYPALIALGMRDAGHGWLVEMQVKALKVGLRIAEVPVTIRPPADGRRQSLAQQVKGTVGTSTKAIFQIFRHATAR
jgi:glycosyltransferase involved in cell wall biosynthesis